MQGHRRYGGKGLGCSYPHPPMCFKFIKSGYKGCPKGDPCKYAHPKICRSSLLSHKCDRVIYHATGTVTPNLYQDLPRNTVSKRPVSDPNPLMHIRLHPCHHVTPQQLTSRNLSRHLLNHIMLYQVRPLISHLFFRSNEGPEVPDVTDATNPKLSAKEHYESSVSPLTSPESKPISSTTVLNEACPNPFSMIQFLFMNIDHLISKTKQKLKFMADLCDANTLFLCFCETFLHDGIGDIEIQIPDFSITRCDRLSRVGGWVCIYMKKSVNRYVNFNYSNSVCELLILKLHTPSLIVIHVL